MAASPGVKLAVEVLAADPVADGVLRLTLARADRSGLPPWAPGAHIDLMLPGGLVRQYSLCGDPADAETWTVAVLREHPGRGGSIAVHDRVAVGDVLTARGPRNHFAFDPAAGARVLFVAGGIGITPLRAMVFAATSAGVDWRLVYAGRSRATMAFLDELVAEHPDRVEVHAADADGRVDLEALLGTPQPGTEVYACGPMRMVEEVERLCVGWPPGSLHVEHFAPKRLGAPTGPAMFEVELEQSGFTVEVPADRTILDVVEDAGVFVLSSCREGTCGTCETPVIEGEVDHRDSVLTPEEQAEGSRMMICVSRAACPRLVLDL